MANFPESLDVWADRTGASFVASSDPNTLGDISEATQGFVGAAGFSQGWNETLLTLMRKYRRGLRISADGGDVIVNSGEAILENTNASKWTLRRNTTDITLAGGHIDVGSLAVDTYYVYGISPVAATTVALQFSTDSNAPVGIGTAPYRKIGWFFNSVGAALAVTFAGSIKDGGDSENIVSHSITVGTAVTASTAYSEIIAIPFVSSGKPIKVTGKLNVGVSSGGQIGQSIVYIDGVAISQSRAATYMGVADASASWYQLSNFYSGVLASGNHTIAIYWNSPASITIYAWERTIVAEEI